MADLAIHWGHQDAIRQRLRDELGLLIDEVISAERGKPSTRVRRKWQAKAEAVNRIYALFEAIPPTPTDPRSAP